MSTRYPYFHGGSNGRDSFGAPPDAFFSNQTFEALEKLADARGSEAPGGVTLTMPLDLSDRQVSNYAKDLLDDSGWLDDPNHITDRWSSMSVLAARSSELGYRLAATELYLGGLACLQSEDGPGQHDSGQTFAVGMGYRYDIDLGPHQTEGRQPAPYMVRTYQTLQAPQETTPTEMRKALAASLAKPPQQSNYDFATIMHAIALNRLSALLLERSQ